MGIYELLFQYRNKKGENCYYGCPLKKDYSVYFNDCHNCKYNCGLDDEAEYDEVKTILCSKRAIDLKVNLIEDVNIIDRNEEGRITKLIYGDNNEEFLFPQIPNISKSLNELWVEYKCIKMICFNIVTGQKEKIYSYGRIARIKNNKNPNWIMLWFIKE